MRRKRNSMVEWRLPAPRDLIAVIAATAVTAASHTADATGIRTAVIVCGEEIGWEPPMTKTETILDWQLHLYPPRHPCSGNDVAITSDADKAQSDPDFRFLMVGCGSNNKADVLLSLARPLSFRRGVQVTLRAGASELTFEGTAGPGFSIRLPTRTVDFMSAAWQSPSDELRVKVHNGRNLLRGVVSLKGWMRALRAFNQTCVYSPPRLDPPDRFRNAPPFSQLG